MEKALLKLNDYQIRELDSGTISLRELARFIVIENYKHHQTGLGSDDFEKEITALYCEEEIYAAHSRYYMVYGDDNQIIAAIRLLLWDFNLELPMQKIFGINPKTLLESSNGQGVIWHIGRFVVSSSKNLSSLSLFKQLTIYALRPIYENESDIIIAECDKKLVRVLSALGMQFDILGESRYYLGSETIPVSLKKGGIVDFYEKYRGLVGV